MIPYYIITLGFFGGNFFILGLINLIAGIRLKNEKAYLYFSFVCFSAMGYYFSAIILYKTDSIELYSKVLYFYNSFALLFMLFLSKFFYYFSKYRKRVSTIFVFVFLLMFLILPFFYHGGYHSRIKKLEEFHIFTGETLYLAVGPISLYHITLNVMILLLYIYGFVSFYHKDFKKKSPALLVIVFLILLSSILFDNYKDFYNIEFIYLGEIAILLFLLIMSIKLSNDVVENSKIKKELIESEKQLDSFFEQTFQYIGILDLEGKIIRANRTALDSLHISGNEVAGVKLWEAPWWSHSQNEQKKIKDAFDLSKKGKVARVETTHWVGDEIHVVDFSTKPIFDKNKNIISIIAEGRDVQDLKKKDEELERAKDIFNNIQAGLHIYKLEDINDYKSLVFVAANPASEKITGIKPEYLIGKKLSEIYPYDRAYELHKKYAEIVRNQKPYEEEYSYIDNKNMRTVYSIKVFPLPNKMVGVFFEDITERKEVEEELQKTKLLLWGAIEQSPAGIIIADAPDVNIKIVNDAALGIRGKSEMPLADITMDQHPKNWQVYYPDGSMVKADALPLSKAVLYGERTYNEEFFIKRSNGEKRWIIANAAPVKNNEKEIVAGIEVFLDITEHKRMSEMMIQTEKMMSVGGLAAGMAHEINNPLSGIMQNVEVLMNRLSGNIPSNAKVAKEVGITVDQIAKYMKKRKIFKFLKLIKDSGDRSATIIENMLSFSRKSEESKSSHKISELLDKTIEIAATDYNLKKMYDFKSIIINREYSDSCPMVVCNAQKIQQVFLNILGNGAQAMAKNKEKKEPSQFNLKIYIEDKDVVIEIGDNGPGIPEEILKRIFEPFFTTKPEGSGTGLGLSVSYFIITEQHNGSIEVESQVGNGTKFIIKLPFGGNEK